MSETDVTDEKERKPWQFQPGQSGNPSGRPKGARNALSEDFLSALHKDFQASGAAAIETMRVEKPNEYVRVIASILPRELNVKIDPLEELTDDELVRRLTALRIAYAAVIGGPGQDGSGTEQTVEYAQTPALPPLH